MLEPITIDFETEAIVGNPITSPPRPVGFSVWVPGQEPVYLGWGHPEYPGYESNNCSLDTAHQYLTRIRNSKADLLFHNVGFDLSVWDHWFCNAKWSWLDQSWKRLHDTMYLLFLDDPYSSNLSLKPNADKYLGMAATEQNELHEWIVKNIPEATRKTAGAFISRAPFELVSRYAIGDVVRTRKLFDLLHAKIVANGMEAAYDRERRLFPTLWMGTKRGIRVDRNRLEHHAFAYSKCLEVATSELAKSLGVAEDHLDHDESFADALESSGAVEGFVLTATGKRSMAKDNLHIVIPEVKVLHEYRSALTTCLGTFMRPWLEKSAADGRLHPNWNQVRQPRDERNSKGTKTGRLSSDDPNFQNVPAEFTTATGEPMPVPPGLHPLPCMRSYCIPDEGHVWLKRDFSSQEIRILAHFEDGSLAEAYRANPSLDPHTMAQQLIHSLIGILYARKEVKITGFSLIYGTGYRGLALQLGTDIGSATAIKQAYLKAMPAVGELMSDVQRRGKRGDSVRTWGGRIYFAEPSKEVQGRWMDFAYKLLNYLIQGSAADQTKESINDWADARSWSHVFLATVHDEINISAPKEEAKTAMGILRSAMNADRFDVPMLSEGYMGSDWHNLEKFE